MLGLYSSALYTLGPLSQFSWPDPSLGICGKLGPPANWQLGVLHFAEHYSCNFCNFITLSGIVGILLSR